MKLRTRLSLYLVALLSFAVLLSGVLFLHLVTNTFRNYLLEEREANFYRLSADIGSIIRSQDALLTDEQLRLYAKETSVEIVLQDRDKNEVARYEGLENPNAKTIETRTYTLLSSAGEAIGSLRLSYDAVDSAFQRALHDFRSHLLQTAGLACLGVTALGCFAAVLLSSYITRPIAQLSRETRRLREKSYDLQLPRARIAEIQTLTEDLDFLSRTLQTQEEIRRQYAQDISHELRTPIANLLLHIEALQDGILTPDESTLATLHREIDRLTDIVERLRDTFEEAQSLFSYDMENIDLSREVLQNLDAFAPQLQSKKAQLIRAVEPRLNAHLDRRAFEHIQSNLLTNALKAIDEGGTIRVSLTKTSEGLLFSVRDNGIGIEKKDLPRLFDRFYRVDSARNSKNGGQGLGLSIVKAMTEAMNGEISVTSTPGKGSEFQILFR
uniref:sensor histidine kinase n=1 Tax=Ndongobacter massiliensis TaxID=1871025 RepID=UPI000930AD7D|nr:HAMP domain-containing sensor histidine kinase [Ndongobacter massiliensis]